MQTSFTPAQLADPDIRDSESILRSCVHCGFCTATCPTYVLLGDELDSPRGRIYLMKQMLESGAPPTPAVVKHIDRCLSCLACMTTCPSGVHYQHLVDHGRAYIEEHLPPTAAGAPAALGARDGAAAADADPAGADRRRPGALSGPHPAVSLATAARLAAASCRVADRDGTAAILCGRRPARACA